VVLGTSGRVAGKDTKMVAHKKTVLLIDDDPDFSVSVRALLESEGYKVFVAESGDDGLRRLVEHNPDVIVLDVMMESVEAGYGVNQAIKTQEAYKEYRDTPIIMVSSLEETPEERYPANEGSGVQYPDRYMTKPIDVAAFLEAVEQAMA
jgi:CheY-like chemotaxis protein